MAISPDAQGITHGEIMVSQYRVNTGRGVQSAQNLSHPIHVMITLVHKIPGQDHQVRLLLLGQVNRFLQISDRHFSTAMKIGQMSDAKAGERRRKIGDLDGDFVQLQPGRLDMPAIADAGPISPDPAGPMPSTSLGCRLISQPSYDMLDHSRSTRPHE